MAIPLVIFTDLDGTLLDHETYSYEPAKPALSILHKLSIPLILASSKTATELMDLRAELGFSHCPAIVENGAGILPAEQTASKTDDKSVYKKLRTLLDSIPQNLRHSFTGFGDWTIDEIAARTGLSPSDARKAASRQFSEPGLWQGNETDLNRFLHLLAEKGVTAKQGGRFLTLSFGTSKGDRIAEVLAQYSGNGTRPTSLALGDAPNDKEMLEATDMGVIIANAHGTQLPPLSNEHKGAIKRSRHLGPTGWNHMVLQTLQELELYQLY